MILVPFKPFLPYTESIPDVNEVDEVDAEYADKLVCNICSNSYDEVQQLAIHIAMYAFS